MSVQMPDLLNYWTVDAVAECIDGVGEELYRKLWSFITPETDGENAPLAKVASRRLRTKRRLNWLRLLLKSSRRNDGPEYQTSAGANEGCDGRL